MKKLFFAAFALVAGVLSAQAQNAIHPRVEVAGNFARSVITNVDGSSVNGLDLAAGVYLAPGITFRQEGAKFANSSLGLNYLSVPVDLGIRVGLGDNLAVSVEAGPSFAYGISSVSDVKGAVDAFKEGGFKRFDAGFNASAALEYSKVYLRVGTELGLVNTLKEAVQKASNKNSSFFIGVGYRF